MNLVKNRENRLELFFKNIKNKNGELPIDNIRIKKTDLIEKIKLLLSKISS